MLPPSVAVSLGNVVAGISVSGEVLPGPSVRNVVALGAVLKDGQLVISVLGDVLPSVRDVAALGDTVLRIPRIVAAVTDCEVSAVLVPVGVMMTVGMLVSP
jgi:hypothetical protein